MTKVGGEYVGKLPPGRSEEHSRTLHGYRNAYENGIISGVEISGCDDCSPSIALAGQSFHPSEAPQLPLDGCKRSPCCACAYVASLADDDENSGVLVLGSDGETADGSVVARLVAWFWPGK